MMMILLCDAARYVDDDGGYDDNDNEDCGHMYCDNNDDDYEWFICISMFNDL